MNIKISAASRLKRKLAAFSLVEVLIGMGVMGTVVGALMTGFTTGFFTMRIARENLRATQIMLEKMETIRLYSWDQVVNNPNFIPRTFTNWYDPQSLNNKGNPYYGEMIIADAPVSSSYSNTLRLVTVRIKWKTGNLAREREFSSFISRYGLQDYVYND
jgi:type II secretory pathway pseudopilin PulG